MSRFNQVRVASGKRQTKPLSAGFVALSALCLRLGCLSLAIGLISSLSACSGLRPYAVNEDVRKVREAKQVRLEDKVQEFGNKTHKFKMLPPKGFLYSQVDTPRGQVFTFSTPPRKDSRTGVFSVSCVASPPGQEHILPHKVLQSVLEPLAQGCVDYHEGSVDSFEAKGRSYVGLQYSGSYGGYYPIVGYAYVIPVQGGFYIVQWQDGEVNFHLTRKVMQNSFDSMEIEY
mgnify:CR=1 FL=1